MLLGAGGRVVLADFGTARIEGDTNLTDTGGSVGSPEFVAPERVRGRQPGPASDLWSLGVVRYAATEGVSPFRRSNTPATLRAVLNATPAPPAAVTGPFAEAVDGLLDKDPGRRPDAARVRALLERTVRPPRPPPVQAVRTVQAVQPAAPVGGGAARLGRRAWLGVATGVAAVVVAAAVTAYPVPAGPFAGPLPDGRLMIGYPGEGDFTGRGREVARTDVAHLDIDRR